MLVEILNNKIIWFIGAGIVLAIVYRMIFAKDKTFKAVEEEYNEVVSSKKYKVKGRFEE